MDQYVRAVCAAIGLVGALIWGAGCASAPLEGPPLRVGLSLNSATYRVGDPVVATVNVYNRTEFPIVLASFAPPSVAFYANQQDGIRRNANPVQPVNAEANRRYIEPDKRVQRTFVFTRLTSAPGGQAIIARVTDCMGKDERFNGDVAVWYSEPMRFTVSEEKGMQRDPHSGIITQAQAVSCARLYAKASPEAPARAVLVPYGKTGLVEWTVFLQHDGKELALWVNAYTGAVRPMVKNTEEEGAKK